MTWLIVFLTKIGLLKARPREDLPEMTLAEDEPIDNDIAVIEQLAEGLINDARRLSPKVADKLGLTEDHVREHMARQHVLELQLRALQGRSAPQET